jgi:hypothetical protein
LHQLFVISEGVIVGSQGMRSSPKGSIRREKGKGQERGKFLANKNRMRVDWEGLSRNKLLESRWAKTHKKMKEGETL